MAHFVRPNVSHFAKPENVKRHAPIERQKGEGYHDFPQNDCHCGDFPLRWLYGSAGLRGNIVLLVLGGLIILVSLYGLAKR